MEASRKFRVAVVQTWPAQALADAVAHIECLVAAAAAQAAWNRGGGTR